MIMQLYNISDVMFIAYLLNYGTYIALDADSTAIERLGTRELVEELKKEFIISEEK